MKTKILTLAIFSFTSLLFSQDRTTVNATNSEVSDNLDLRAVASVFGDSDNLEDFERRLNYPKLQLSNLDLNNDNQVDYLRVIESVEDRSHLIVIQAVLDKDVYQDVATVEVEKDRNNKIQVQVVGDVYMYGNNYIYEPIYVHTPVFYSNFWVNDYRPYYSTWNWNYYPTHYYAWNPFPIFRYRRNVELCINLNYQYNYVNYRRCQVAYTNYYDRRGNGYERQYPNRSFSQRNQNVANRYDLEQTRPKTRNVASNNIREYSNPRNTSSPRSETPRVNSNPRNSNPSIENSNSNPRNSTSPRSETPRVNSNPRNSNVPRVETQKENRNSENSTRTETSRDNQSRGNRR